MQNHYAIINNENFNYNKCFKEEIETKDEPLGFTDEEVENGEYNEQISGIDKSQISISDEKQDDNPSVKKSSSISPESSRIHSQGIEKQDSKSAESVLESPDIFEPTSSEDTEMSPENITVHTGILSYLNDASFYTRDHMKSEMDEEDSSNPTPRTLNKESSSFSFQLQPITLTPQCEQNLSLSKSPPTNHKPVVTKRYLRKLSLQSGKAHKNSRGEFIDEKCWEFVDCANCRLKCNEKLDSVERETICRNFWGLANWQSQTVFIVNSVRLLDIKRRTTNNPYRRTKHREYYLNSKQICQKTFLKTLCISGRRIDYALRRKSKDGLISPDKRGGHPYNKTPESTLLNIKEFLNKLPKFKSLYSNSEKVYFHPELTIEKIHQLYLQNIEESNNENLKVSYKVFQKYFQSWEGSFYIPKKGTCQLCDTLKIQIEAANPECKKSLTDKHELHLSNATYARKCLSMMTAESHTDKNILTFSFDMGKTQPIPYLNTSIAYYKHQLWLFNLGINNRHDNQGYICIWNETDGKRGANEVCSAIFEFLRTQNLKSVKKIVTFSDGCVGQSMNKTVVAFMMFACEYFEIQTWEHAYQESGHSCLPNNSDFKKIESRKKKLQFICTDDEWADHILEANLRKPFKVIRMKEKILDFKTLQKALTFRNYDIEGNSFCWLNVKWFSVAKNDRYIHYKTSLHPESPLISVDFSPVEGINFPDVLPQKCPRIEISFEKYNDLLSILKFIPPNFHEFFQNLPHKAQANKNSSYEYFPDGFYDDESEELAC